MATNVRAQRVNMLLRTLTLLTLSVITTLAAQAADLSRRIQFNITPQLLSTALVRFSEQAHLQFNAPGQSLDEVTTRGVQGEYTPDAALAVLLRDTGLEFQLIDDGTVAIRSKEKVTAVEQEAMRVVQVDENKNSASSPGVSPPADTKIEEVVVTAQRREERLQDVPISMSVLGTETLERPALDGLRDALRTVPGIASREDPQSGAAKYAVRGVVSNASLFNGAPTVGFYLDEIPFAFTRIPISPDANAYDLERVEVLRGPQGTLYGASSLNGVIRVITKDADLNEFEGKVRGSVSSTRYADTNYRADAAVNLPLIPGKLAARVVGGYSDNSGWIDAPSTGLSDINGSEQTNMRLKLNAAPTEHFGVRFLAWLSRNDRDGSATSTQSRVHTGINRLETGSQDFDAYGLTLTYDFPAFTALSSTSYLTFEGGSHNVSPTTGGFADFLVSLDSDVTAQEFRLNSIGEGAWRWSAGGIYRKAKDDRLQDDLNNLAITGVVHQVYESESYAVYGELTRQLSERFSLTGGLRYFEDRVTTTELSGASITDIPFGSKTENFDALTPRLVLSFELNPATNLYASYSEGFRSGFTQDAVVLRQTGGFAPSVEPDTLKNYEVGAKGNIFDRRLSYDFAVYYIDWQDSVQSLRFNIAPNVAISGAVNSVAVRGMGVDLGLSLQVTDRFTVGGTGSWNDLHFTEDVIGTAGVIFPKDARPQESPEWTAGAFADYTFPLNERFQTRLGGSLNYVSRMTNLSAPPALQFGENLLSAQASIALEATSGWELTLFGNNLTNEDHTIRPPTADRPTEADRYRPRTIGLQFSTRF